MPRALSTGLFVLVTIVAGIGCQPQATAPVVDCSTVTVPTYAELSILPMCTSCHSSTNGNREGAPGNVNFDTYAAAVAQAVSGAAQVNSGYMPPANGAQPTTTQREAFYAWALCGTPQ